MKPVLVSTPAGTLAVGATATAVVMCDYTHSPHFSAHCHDCAPLECDKSMTDTVVARLLEYFTGTRTAFNIPVAPAGTVPTKSVGSSRRNTLRLNSQLHRHCSRDRATARSQSRCTGNSIQSDKHNSAVPPRGRQKRTADRLRGRNSRQETPAPA